MHKDYSRSNPIQISVYTNKIIIWNEGQLPDDWTVESLKTKHPSRPYNPDIANCFFRAGLIEAWGRGTIKILNECRQAKIALPVFKYDLSGFVIEVNYNIKDAPIRIRDRHNLTAKIIILLEHEKQLLLLIWLKRQVLQLLQLKEF